MLDLWVDKYSPKTGADLIGNESALNEIRQWLTEVRSKLDTLVKINQLKSTLKLKYHCKVLAKNITYINDTSYNFYRRSWDQLTKPEKMQILIYFTELETFGLEQLELDNKKPASKKRTLKEKKSLPLSGSAELANTVMNSRASQKLAKTNIVRAKNLEIFADILFEYIELLFVYTQVDTEFKSAIILSGQPGSGKTASANVVSRETGFEVMSFNAGNQRSKSAIQETITRVYENISLIKFKVANIHSSSWMK